MVLQQDLGESSADVLMMNVGVAGILKHTIYYATDISEVRAAGREGWKYGFRYILEVY